MITRFAPSPTGPLHLGHAYSAILTHDMAHAAGGTFLLRIEDIDSTRVRAEWTELIERDLAWLGLDWPTPVRRQSEHLPIYAAALQRLAALGLIYPCSCNRADIRAAAAAPQEGAPASGPDGPIYPGTCRGRGMDSRVEGDALRLDMARAAATLDETLRWQETGTEEPGPKTINGADLIGGVGDIVLARRLTGDPAYHLAVTVDDAAQAITDVIRGEDLAPATPIHVLLQHLLDLPTPIYHHHRLIRDDTGRRLAKRDDDRALRTYREDGRTPADIRAMVGL